MYCPKCGKPVKDTSKFCPACGAQIEHGNRAEKIAPGDETAGLIPENRAESAGDSVKKKSAWVIIIAACAALVFAAVCFVAIMVVTHLFRPEEDHNSTTAYAAQTETEYDTDAESEAVSEEQTDPVEDSTFNDPEHIKEVLHRYDNVPEKEIEPFTEEELHIFDKTDEEISALTESFLDEEGWIEADEIEAYLDTIEAYLSTLQGSGTVAGYERTDTAVSVLFESGISYYIPAPIEGYLGSGDEETRILALENFSGWDYNIFVPDKDLLGKDLRTIARKIDESSEMYRFSESDNYREAESIDIAYLRNLESFKLLLWHGHGGYFATSGGSLQTKQKYNKEELKQDHALDLDLRLGRVILVRNSKLQKTRFYAITLKFVDKYFPEIDDAIVYLGACDACATDELAKSFFRRGARCVIGYTKFVHVTAEMSSRAQLFERLRNGESLRDAVENTRNDAAIKWQNMGPDPVLTAYYADGIVSEDQYLDPPEDKKAGPEDGQDDAETSASVPDPQTLTVGQEITFGQYYQEYEYPNDKQPIEWTVLDVKDGKALIISKYALFSMQFVDYAGPCTWEDSYLREQLNGAFYNEAFSEEEKKHIGRTTVVTEPNSQYGTDGGNDTVDRLFVLSEREAELYFASDEARQAGGTSWAYHQGLELISPETGDYSSVVFHGIYGYQPEYNCSYWLRTMGADSGAPVAVDEKGRIYLGGYYGYYYPDADTKYMSNLPTVGVRPVLWLTSD